MGDKDEEEATLNESLEENEKQPVSEEKNIPEPAECDQETLKKVPSDSNLSGNEAQKSSKDQVKIDILLKATGNAPIMKRKRWAVNPDQHIGWVSAFVKRYLKLDANDRLFLYINQMFAPAPDQTIQNLYDCYGSDGKLTIHYCKTQAWG